MITDLRFNCPYCNKGYIIPVARNKKYTLKKHRVECWNCKKHYKAIIIYDPIQDNYKGEVEQIKNKEDNMKLVKIVEPTKPQAWDYKFLGDKFWVEDHPEDKEYYKLVSCSENIRQADHMLRDTYSMTCLLIPKGEARVVAENTENKKEDKPMEKTPNKLLIRFMEKKQAWLGPDVNYFNFDDSMAIYNWSEELAESVLTKMKECLRKESKGLTPSACPFCIKDKMFRHNDCESCEWKKEHGGCDNTNGGDFQEAQEVSIQKGGIPSGKLFYQALEEIGDPTKPPKPTEIKLWNEQSENDHPEQPYIKLRRCGRDAAIDVVNNKGLSQTLLLIGKQGLCRVGVATQVSNFINMDKESRIALFDE